MDFSSPLLTATRDRLRVRFGDSADSWWDRLPGLVDRLARQWRLHVGDPVGRGNTSLVVRCTRSDGSAGILKLVPESDLTAAEATALRSWAPSPKVPELWEADESRGALLLEAIPDETPVAETRSSLPLEDVGALIRGLHGSGRPEVGSGIVPLSARIEFMFGHWHQRQEEENRPHPVALGRAQRGYELAHALASSAPRRVLLHGDLHPWNVLDGGPDRGLVAIDPRACVGDPAFDGVDWVIWPKDDPANWEARCARVAGEIEVDGERLWEWCRTFASMLAATEASQSGETRRVEAFMAMAP